MSVDSMMFNKFPIRDFSPQTKRLTPNYQQEWGNTMFILCVLMKSCKTIIIQNYGYRLMALFT